MKRVKYRANQVKLNKNKMLFKNILIKVNATVRQPNDMRMKIDAYKKKYKIKNIVACIFYGRKIYTNILFRYLDKNLRKNGGILDEIVILYHLQRKKVNITIEESYLKKYLSEHTDGYRLVKFYGVASFKRLYTALQDNDLIFKIDDDIVFISNGTFENMVEEYLNKSHFILSANVINHHTFSMIHSQRKLMQDFYERPDKTWVKTETKSVKSYSKNCITSSISWIVNPKCVAIAHESFLYNIYKNKFNLDAYNFKLHDFHRFGYNAWRINFILFKGVLFNKIHSMVGSDENILSQILPMSKKKHCYGIGSAVVAHFSYSTYQQIQYLSKTNILEKYYNLSFNYFNLHISH